MTFECERRVLVPCWTFPRASALWATALMLVLSASWPVTASAHTTSYDLATHADVTFSHMSHVVSGGDVNGDGTPDLVGIKFGTNLDYVIFGGNLSGEVDPTDLGEGGFAVEGADPDHVYVPFAGGDINGDGLGDLIFGDRDAGNNDRSLSGTAYVVFGKTDNETVGLVDFDAGTQGNQGYRIDGAFHFSLAAAHAASAGDQNGDGLGDVVMGAEFVGAAYVVFGKTDGAPIDLLDFERGTHGDAGYVIHTKASNESGHSHNVAYAGDVNADGIDDTVIGVIHRPGARGWAYVVFGKPDPEPLDVRDEDAFKGHGFGVKGPEQGASASTGLTTAGDMNADGKSEVVIGVPFWGGFERGSAYVVWGKKGSKTVELADLGDKGFRIKGQENSGGIRDVTGRAVDFAGDVNADGRPDVVVGAAASHRGRDSAGAALVVYGKKSSKTVRLADMGRHGYRLDGIEEGGGAGSSVAGVGDVNGDGRADVMTNCGYDPFTEEGFARLKACLVWGL